MQWTKGCGGGNQHRTDVRCSGPKPAGSAGPPRPHLCRITQLKGQLAAEIEAREKAEAELAQAKAVIADLPDHFDLDAAVFEANRLKAELAELQQRSDEASVRYTHLQCERDALKVALITIEGDTVDGVVREIARKALDALKPLDVAQGGEKP